MTLSEKICYCRRKAGISQEVLASRLGVSRQAVSKWETGESEPELSKIKALASEFDVSLDWLLSDADPREEKTTYGYNEGGSTSSAGWIKSVPGFLGSLFRKYGWLGGVYLAVSGLATAFIGWLARLFQTKRSTVSADLGLLRASAAHRFLTPWRSWALSLWASAE